MIKLGYYLKYQRKVRDEAGYSCQRHYETEDYFLGLWRRLNILDKIGTNFAWEYTFTVDFSKKNASKGS